MAELERAIHEQEAAEQSQVPPDPTPEEMAELGRAIQEQTGEEAGSEAAGEAATQSLEAGGQSARSGSPLQIAMIVAAIAAALVGGYHLVTRARVRPTRQVGGAAAPPASAAPIPLNSVHVEVAYIHKQGDYLDHKITYRADAEVSAGLSTSLRGTTFRSAAERPEGTGVGDYDERGVSTPTGQPSCSVTRQGRVAMEVVVVPEIGELTAKIQGRVTRAVQGNPDCGANVGSGDRTDVVCVFQGVDLERGGHYRAEDHPPEFINVDINQETCTLDLAPMVGDDGRPIRSVKR